MELVSQTALQKGTQTRNFYNMAFSITTKGLVFRSLKKDATKVKVIIALEQVTKAQEGTEI